jgi:GntR family transcriptional regulator
MPDKTIDFNSYLPYYQQLYELLKERLLSKEWQPGDRFLSEPELCQAYRVSRTVVRAALAELERDGLVSRRKSRGTFVLGTKISEGLAQKLSGFYQDMSEQGLPTSTRVLRQAVVPADARTAGLLDLEPGAAVVRLERLRFVEGVPLTVVTSWLPLALCSQLQEVDLTDRSLYEFLEQECRLVITRARRTLEACLADEKTAALLAIRAGDALIRLESTGYLEDGTAVEYFLAYHRGDRAKFEINLARVRDRWRALD